MPSFSAKSDILKPTGFLSCIAMTGGACFTVMTVTNSVGKPAKTGGNGPMPACEGSRTSGASRSRIAGRKDGASWNPLRSRFAIKTKTPGGL